MKLTIRPPMEIDVDKFTANSCGTYCNWHTSYINGMYCTLFKTWIKEPLIRCPQCIKAEQEMKDENS